VNIKLLLAPFLTVKNLSRMVNHSQIIYINNIFLSDTIIYKQWSQQYIADIHIYIIQQYTLPFPKLHILKLDIYPQLEPYPPPYLKRVDDQAPQVYL